MPDLRSWTRLSLIALLCVGVCGCDDSASRSGKGEDNGSKATPAPSQVAAGEQPVENAPPAMITPGEARPEMPAGHPPIVR